ncbi:MAG TPA: serine hydrolase domain-containing protein [Chitinophagaceae bacterium]|nr:serine hydrolase domain-containing protein [Chitinophagaceae bacterium]
MKNLLYPLAIAILVGCNHSGHNEPVVREDSLAYYPPTPKLLPKEEFRYYYNIAKNHFDSLLFKRGFNGQLLIAKNGTIVFEKAMGFADMRTKDTLTANTPMHIASVSKTFTSMAVLHLMEEGSLNLDDTLGKYFPGFPYKDVTIKMLLSHRSGLPNYLHYLSLLKKDDTCYSNQDVLNSLFTLQPRLEFRSGTRFSYSNTNFVLLAMIVEKITGKPFPAYLKETFFAPLQMTHTFVYAHQDTLTPTPSFEWTGRLWESDPFDCTYGDKNVYTTTHDLLKWDQALNSGQLFKKETLDAAFTPLSNERRSIHNYGLGWRMMIFPNGKKLIYHNGRWHGSNAVFVRFPDENATMILIGNKYNRNIYYAARTAYNLFGSYLPGQDKDDDNETDVNSVGENSIKEETTPDLRTNSSKTKH